MTTATTHTVSAAAFLFGDEKDSVKALAAAIKEEGVVGAATSGLGTLSRTALRAVGDHVAEVAHDLIDLDFDDIIVDGWRKFAALHAAAERTCAEGGSSEVVDLASHSITSKHTPRVELEIDGAPVATLKFELSLTFTLKAVVATVSEGYLVQLHAGLVDVEGSLTAAGRVLAKRSGHFDLRLLIRLGDGVPLLVDRGAETTVASSGTVARPGVSIAPRTVTITGATVTATPRCPSRGPAPGGGPRVLPAPVVEVEPVEPGESRATTYTATET
jgi:hypothetical protein